MNKFKTDLIFSYGLTGHCKAEKCFDIAWDHGHSAGLKEVVNYFDELSELIVR